MANNIKPFEELTLADDFMFYQVMQDDEICIGVLERLLKIQIDHIERQELQKEIKPYYQSKYIKLDVYVKNDNRVYDIEIQNEDMDELPKRVRYYQSMIDSNELLKGMEYRKLPESIIIFICTGDPFGKGFPQYTFKNICLEEKDIILKDESTKYFFNSDAADKATDIEIRAFLDYIKNKRPTDSFTNTIDLAVKKVKEDESLRGIYMCEPIRIQDAKWAARLEVAKNLLRMNVNTHEQIAQGTDLPLRKIQELAKEIAAENKQKE
ncbi:MAG: Rpn family recombination-promoting nuclease/putative transposase [Treponema sp.]|nr:Rpn family recombination-promoting nuclease/putative transposase [Treponema sp.]